MDWDTRSSTVKMLHDKMRGASLATFNKAQFSQSFD